MGNYTCSRLPPTSQKPSCGVRLRECERWSTSGCAGVGTDGVQGSAEGRVVEQRRTIAMSGLTVEISTISSSSMFETQPNCSSCFIESHRSPRYIAPPFSVLEEETDFITIPFAPRRLSSPRSWYTSSFIRIEAPDRAFGGATQ